jgi:hypothetical protein
MVALWVTNWLFGTQESASFLKKRSKKRLIPAGFVTGRARCFNESKFFCFFLFTKRSAFLTSAASRMILMSICY